MLNNYQQNITITMDIENAFETIRAIFCVLAIADTMERDHTALAYLGSDITEKLQEYVEAHQSDMAG